MSFLTFSVRSDTLLPSYFITLFSFACMKLSTVSPSLFGHPLVASHFQKQGILNKRAERVRFARRRFGRYDTLDVVSVLFGYAISDERTLEAFYEGVHPFTSAFMALLG
jgi:hypothetical protein